MVTQQDFKALLSGGDKRSIAQAQSVVDAILADTSRFDELFKLLCLREPLITMRALDVIEKVTRTHPELLEPYKKIILKEVAKITDKEVKWHVAQLMPRLSLSPSEKKKVLLLLESDYLCDKSSIVRTNALQALADLALQDKSIKSKVIQLLKSAMVSGTPAMQSRARILLDTL